MKAQKRSEQMVKYGDTETYKGNRELSHDQNSFLGIDNLLKSTVSSKDCTKLASQPNTNTQGRHQKTPFRKTISSTSLGTSKSNSSNSRMNSRANSRPTSSVFWNPLVPRRHKQLNAGNAMCVENRHVKAPFKQTRKPQLNPITVATECSPSHHLQEKMLVATYEVAASLARQPVDVTENKKGTLVKGKLLPMCPVHVNGPAMDQCQGIVTHSQQQTRYMVNPLATRRRVIIPQSDYMYERPQTGESRHCTSIASDSSFENIADTDSFHKRFSLESNNELNPVLTNIIQNATTQSDIDLSTLSLTTRPKCDLSSCDLLACHHTDLSSRSAGGHTLTVTEEMNRNNSQLPEDVSQNSDIKTARKASQSLSSEKNKRCKESDICKHDNNGDGSDDDTNDHDRTDHDRSSVDVSKRCGGSGKSTECVTALQASDGTNGTGTSDKQCRQNLQHTPMQRQVPTMLSRTQHSARNFLAEKSLERKLRCRSAGITRKRETAVQSSAHSRSNPTSRVQSGRRKRIPATTKASTECVYSESAKNMGSSVHDSSGIDSVQANKGNDDSRAMTALPQHLIWESEFHDLDKSLMEIRKTIGRFISNEATSFSNEDLLLDDVSTVDTDEMSDGARSKNEEQSIDDNTNENVARLDEKSALAYQRQVLQFCDFFGEFSETIPSCRRPPYTDNVQRSASGGSAVGSVGTDCETVPKQVCSTLPATEDMSTYEAQLVKDYHCTLTDHNEEYKLNNKPFLQVLCDRLPQPEKVEKTSTQICPSIEDLMINAATKVQLKSRFVEDTGNATSSHPPVCFPVNAQAPPDHIYYFAYGLDMNPKRFSTYIQREVKVRLWGLLFGFQLVFNKKVNDDKQTGLPNIQFNPFCSVEGCLYLLRTSELAMVDSCIGYPEYFEHVVLPVWMLNCDQPDSLGIAQYCVAAFLYVARDHCIHTDGVDVAADSFALDQCLKGADLLTPAYKQHISQRANIVH